MMQFQGVHKYGSTGGKLHAIKGVEIFSAGLWKGTRYTRSDLDEIIANFGKVGFSIPVKLGHVMNTDAPAVGWIKELRRAGDVLLADIVDIPEAVFAQVQQRAFDNVSAEIAFNLERNGKKFRLALTAIALLGGANPAVNLRPIREATFLTAADLRGTEVHVYTSGEQTIMTDNRISDLNASIKTLGDKIDSEKDAEKKVALMAERDKLRDQLFTATEEAHSAEVERLEGAGGDSSKLALLERQNAAMSAQIKQLADEAREAKVSDLVGDLTLPKLRPHFEALARLSEEDERTVKFTADGAEKAAEATVLEILTDAKKVLNGYAANLLKGLSVPGKRASGGSADWDDPEAEIQKRAEKLHAERKDDSFTMADAMEKVLQDDPELRSAYNAS